VPIGEIEGRRIVESFCPRVRAKSFRQFDGLRFRRWALEKTSPGVPPGFLWASDYRALSCSRALNPFLPPPRPSINSTSASLAVHAKSHPGVGSPPLWHAYV